MAVEDKQPSSLQTVETGAITGANRPIAEIVEVVEPHEIDRNAGKNWWQIQAWNTKHSKIALEFRKSHSLGRFPYEDSYLGPEYERYGIKGGGVARAFPKPNPLELRGRYGAISWEGKALNALSEAYHQGKMINFGYLALLGGMAYGVHYLSKVTSVDLPEDFKKWDVNNTGTSQKTKFYLPDYKLFDASATDRETYIKRYNASVFSCWGHYPLRKLAGLIDPSYYARAYHLHYRRQGVVGEYFTDYRILETTQNSTLLQSELFSTLAHVHAMVDDDGVLTMQLSTALPEDHWTQQWHGTALGDYVVGPAAKGVNAIWTRAWMTSSCNFFLRHHCSEVYVKPLVTAQNLTFLDSLA
eukprot:TRINITY_DN864_c1_g1_i1.p1 TRINITY_DN864_c1_g1~~TRINITY_DN864_c1_g1_i1.p1  ORF type:complete len:373 (+),score=47.95 TRINITY_DN864_c1_g1_i1:53-1120(+)